MKRKISLIFDQCYKLSIKTMKVHFSFLLELIRYVVA